MTEKKKPSGGIVSVPVVYRSYVPWYQRLIEVGLLVAAISLNLGGFLKWRPSKPISERKCSIENIHLLNADIKVRQLEITHDGYILEAWRERIKYDLDIRDGDSVTYDGCAFVGPMHLGRDDSQ